MQQPDALQAKRIIKIQAVLGLALVAIVLPFGGSVALSVLVGAGICLLANTLFAVWVFRSYRAQEPGRLVMRLYGAEIGKVGLALGLFAVAFAVLHRPHIPALVGAYVAVQVVSILIAAQTEMSPAELNRRRDQRKPRPRSGSRILK